MDWMDWIKQNREALAIIALFTGASGLLGSLLGAWIGHRLTLKRFQQNLFFEKRAEYISEFIGQAYANTTYVALPYPKIEKIEEGLSKSFDFTALGQRAGFFLSDESRAAIDSLTKSYYHALVEFSQQKSKEKYKGDHSRGRSITKITSRS